MNLSTSMRWLSSCVVVNLSILVRSFSATSCVLLADIVLLFTAVSCQRVLQWLDKAFTNIAVSRRAVLALLAVHETCDFSPGWLPARSGLVQATYTCVSLSPSTMIWYWPRHSALWLGSWLRVKQWHLAVSLLRDRDLLWTRCLLVEYLIIYLSY